MDLKITLINTICLFYVQLLWGHLVVVIIKRKSSRKIYPYSELGSYSELQQEMLFFLTRYVYWWLIILQIVFNCLSCSGECWCHENCYTNASPFFLTVFDYLRIETPFEWSNGNIKTAYILQYKPYVNIKGWCRIETVPAAIYSPMPLP